MEVLQTGLYEQLINKLIAQRLEELDTSVYFYKNDKVLSRSEASRHLTLYVSAIIKYALESVRDDDRPGRQIDLINKIILLLIDEIRDQDLSENLVESEGRILEAILNRIDNPFKDLKKRVDEIMPYTRLSQSELFTGSHAGLSLDSELKKEILSSDRIQFMVSFIKWTGIRIFEHELREFTKRGKLQVITTTYMGASDIKAIDFLASLPNTEVKVSYNSQNVKLHAKAYLFLRNSGYHTGYIGSSNLSKSAMTTGREWNMKVTTQEVGHIIDKFVKTFETEWNDREFEFYKAGSLEDRSRFLKSINTESISTDPNSFTYFDIEPYPFQKEILERLDTERSVHNRFRNLIVAATGTGKTVVSAFDFRRIYRKNRNARFLYVAHRKEILEQAQNTYRMVLRDGNFGELWVGGNEPSRYDQLFASVQTLNNRLDELSLSPDFFDYIIVDEVHHIKADSYRPILDRFNPKILLGLTATPERMDGADILEDFDQRIAAEIRLPEALNKNLLVPFQYFGVSDPVDISNVAWTNGRYQIGELTRIYTQNDQRVGHILENCSKYLTDLNAVKALGFCVSQEHARYMAEKFISKGLRANYLTSGNASERDILRQQLLRGDINYLFVVDIFNEGVDIPEIDTVLFLRPTESLTIFLQQLGRGLRTADGKSVLTVLDFVGNARAEYDFEHKFRALVGKTHTSITKQIEDDFPHLPLGCSIILEKQAKEVILANIHAATNPDRRKLVQRIQQFRHASTRKLSLQSFIEFHNYDLELVYKYKLEGKSLSWSRLCQLAGQIEDFHEPNETELSRFISTRLITIQSISYFSFLDLLLRLNGSLADLKQTVENARNGRLGKSVSVHESLLDLTNNELDSMGLMVHFDVWQKSGSDVNHDTLESSLSVFGKNPILSHEIRELLNLLTDRLDHVETDINLGFDFPLRVHGRYTRDQILASMQIHRFEKASSNREGVANNKELNCEALFVTLHKSDDNYSATTLYEDYAVSEELFHWQSQNASIPERGKGKSYITHHETGKKILLFVRERNNDQYGNTKSYVYLGPAEISSHHGRKPMNITWHLREPIPGYLINESRKLAVG
jgi:superfamily II DNA or RNA helicase/HKD family nuclease